MALSLYDVTVASYLQTLGAVSGYLDKAASTRVSKSDHRTNTRRRDLGIENRERAVAADRGSDLL